MERFREPKVIAVTAVVVVLLLVLITRCSQRESASPSTEFSRSPVTSAASTSTTTSGSGAGTASTAVPERDDIDAAGTNPEFRRDPSNPADAWWLNLFLGVGSPSTETERLKAWNDPTNSDLDPQTAAGLSMLGKAVLSAHLTGQGRDQWPQYFTTVPPRATSATNLVVHGAAAAKAGGVGDGWARVGVLWSAVVPMPTPTQVTMFTEFLFKQDTAGVWQPRQCWDTGKTTSCELDVLATKPVP